MSITPLWLALATLAVASPAPTGSPPPAATIHIHDFAFVPKRLEIAAGTTVTVINDDDEAHTARAADGSFSSGGLDTHAAWTHGFVRPGTYAYFCELHPDMTGTIVVDRAEEHR